MLSFMLISLWLSGTWSRSQTGKITSLLGFKVGKDLEGWLHHASALQVGRWLGGGSQGGFGHQGGGAFAEMQGLVVAKGSTMGPLSTCLRLVLLCRIAEHLELHQKHWWLSKWGASSVIIL